MSGLSVDRKRQLKEVGRHGILLTWLAIALFPFYWIVTMSLKETVDALAIPPEWIFVPIFDNYLELMRDPDFAVALANSFLVVGGSVLLVLLIGVPGAYALSRYEVPAERDVMIWILSSRMLPPVAVIVPFFILYGRLDLLDTRIGLTFILTTINIAIVVWVMKAFFDGIPPALEEAAMVDGATRFQAFRRVVLPTAIPGIIAVAIISFIFGWIELVFSLVLTGTETRTAPIYMYQFIGSRSIDWGMLAAASTVLVMPIVLFLVLVNKYLAAGLSFGVALKE
ncbi:carbohydrate ABC transporter permease [Natrarchaeobius sp. A-rgal3]|uniref:carbohydrate ABC transporter permease n=1 Tax=Natrarchaeobius versutus TaxID=1679078 RepID=UPI00350EE2E5